MSLPGWFLLVVFALLLLAGLAFALLFIARLTWPCARCGGLGAGFDVAHIKLDRGRGSQVVPLHVQTRCPACRGRGWAWGRS